MTFTFTQPIVLVTRTVAARDGYGNDVYGQAATVVTGAFAPGGSTEQVQGQDLIVTQPTVYLPPGTDVTALDAVVVDPVLADDGTPTTDESGALLGEHYDVDGTPSSWQSPFTSWNPGVEVRLRRVTG